MSLLHCLFQVFSYIFDLFDVIEISTIFKVQIEASVIEIDRTDSGDPIIGDKDLPMDESRIVFTDLHSAFNESPIEGSRHIEDDLLIRDTRSDDADIDASFGSQDQSVDELRVDDEIRSHDVDIVIGLIEDVHVDVLGSDLVIKRRLSIRDDVALSAVSSGYLRNFR